MESNYRKCSPIRSRLCKPAFSSRVRSRRCEPVSSSIRQGSLSGFTILEVIIACALFFMVSFAILAMVAQGLKGARSLQQKQPDCGLLAAELTLTNQLIEGVESGDFEQSYPGIYPGFTWSREVVEVYSNGLFAVTFVIRGPGGKKGGETTSENKIYLWRPNSPPGSASKGGF